MTTLVLLLQQKILVGLMVLLSFLKNDIEIHMLFFTTILEKSLKKTNKFSISTVKDQTNTFFLTTALLSQTTGSTPMNFMLTLI